MPEAQHEYLVTVLPGLEDIAAAELQAKLGSRASLSLARRGKVIVRSAQAPEALLVLRSIDNLYILVTSLNVGPHRVHLHDLETAVARLDLTGAVALAGSDPDDRLSVFVNASRVGKQTYSRFELAAAATRGVLTRQRRWVEGSAEAHAAEFRLDLEDDEALFSLRLTPSTFRFRGDARRFTEAALRPTVAHALVWLSGLSTHERFLDPFCGSGTIVAERAAYPAVSVLGSDIAEDAVRAAQANVPPGTAVHRWDARNLPLDAGSVDTVVTNLPFGRQILCEAEIAPLYDAFCRELARVLSGRGQAWLLTDRVDELNRAAVAAGMAIADLRQLSLKGLHPHLFQVGRPPCRSHYQPD